MDNEFASRIASLERSIGAVGSERERYLSSAISGAFARGAQQAGNVSSVGSSAGPGFRVTFPIPHSGRSAATSDSTPPPAPGDVVIGGMSVVGKHYDPAAVPPHSSLRSGQGGGGQGRHQQYHNAQGAASAYGTAVDAAAEDYYYVIDPSSEAYSVCPRCAHLSKLEESLATVDDQYRSELEHLRRMIAQVDSDRLDVVQRLKASQEDVENLRAQVLDKDRHCSEWRQRALVAEEDLSAAQRVSSANQWEWERKAAFALDTMTYVLATAESDSRLDAVASEQAARSALWSIADASRIEMQRRKHIEQLRREQERLASKTLLLHEAEAEYRRCMDDAANKSAAGRGLIGSSSTLSSIMLEGRSRSSSRHHMAPNKQQPANHNDQRRNSPVPRLIQKCLSGTNLAPPAAAGMQELEEPPLRDASPETAENQSAKGEEEPLRGDDHNTAPRFTDDVSFGDLELEEDDEVLLTNLAAGSNGGAPASELQRWQRLLAESDNARRQLEGHLLTEQHFSNELQIEVDDLSRREETQSESYRRVKIELLELQFRLELALQSRRKLEQQIASSGGASQPCAGGGGSAASSQQDTALIEKELKVLRQLYTSAKEDAIAARKELQDLQLVGAVHGEREMEKKEQHAPPLSETSPKQLPALIAASGAAEPPPSLSAHSIAVEVLKLISPQLSTMHESISGVARQLTLSEDLLIPPSGQRKNNNINNNKEVVEGGIGVQSATAGEENIPLGGTTTTQRTRKTHSSFASLLLERVQRATEVHQEAVKSMLETSMHGTDARISELADQIRTSLRPTPNVSLLDASSAHISGGGGGYAAYAAPPAAVLAAASTSLGTITPNPNDLSESSTPRNHLAPTSHHHQHGIPSSLTSPVIGPATQQGSAHTQDSGGNPLALGKLHDAMASMRNIMRNVLFTTSHNQKLLGEKLDELTIGQRAIMSEWSTTAASLVESSQRFSSGAGFSQASGGAVGQHSPTFQIGRQVSDSVVMCGSPSSTTASPIMQHSAHGSPKHSAVAQPHELSGIQYSVPPALQQKMQRAQQAVSHVTDAGQSQKRSLSVATEAEATKIIDQFVLEEGHSYSSALVGENLSSPPAPPLPHFSKVSAAPPSHPSPAAPPRSGSPGTSSDAGGGARRSGSPAGSNSGGGLPPLQRRASHRWDEEEEDDSPKTARKGTVQSSAQQQQQQRSWRKIKNPYEDSD